MKYINIKYPLQDDTVNNFLFDRTLTTRDALKSNLLLLLFTSIGERYYMPDYGLNLYRYLFEPNDDIQKNTIIEDIKTRVSRYIPEITIENIDIVEVGLEEHTIQIKIDFTYTESTFSEQDSITINI